jgi:enoyl-CoA hydratase
VAAAATGLNPQDFSTLLIDEREDRLVVLLNLP